MDLVSASRSVGFANTLNFCLRILGFDLSSFVSIEFSNISLKVIQCFHYNMYWRHVLDFQMRICYFWCNFHWLLLTKRSQICQDFECADICLCLEFFRPWVNWETLNFQGNSNQIFFILTIQDRQTYRTMAIPVEKKSHAQTDQTTVALGESWLKRASGKLLLD